MPRVKIEIDYAIGPHEGANNEQIRVTLVKINEKIVNPYRPELEPDPSLLVWDILGTDNEALTIELRGV